MKYLISKQQSESLSYFNAHAARWHNRAGGEGSKEKVNVIKQRNDYAISVIKQMRGIRSAADIGCGSGELVNQMAKIGVNTLGIDYAQNMINIAQKEAKRQGLRKARYVCDSVFSYPFKKSELDVIVANGFIEYLSLEELDNFLSIVSRALKKGGIFVVSSRNRLFNLFSLNKFTEDEIEAGNIHQLLREAMVINKAKSLDEISAINPKLAANQNFTQMITGVEVSIRHQFTPSELIQRLHKKKFKTKEIFPIHIHGVSPEFKNNYPEVHVNISNLLQNFAAQERHLLIPFASTFMLTAEKN